DLLDCSFQEMRALRGTELSMIFQDPMTSLDPGFTIGSPLRAPQRIPARGPRAEAKARSIELLELVGVPAPAARLRQFPHQLSGGLRQRVLSTTALADQPRLLVAD